MQLLRHAKASFSSGECIGQLDLPLSGEGEQQVRQLVANWPLQVPAKIYCSDSTRARDTALPIASALNIPCEFNPRLREIHFGEWEGQSWEQLYRDHPKLMARWGEDWINTAPPGGETGRQLYQRVSAASRQIEPGSLVVAHAGSLRALYCALRAQPLKNLFQMSFAHAVPLEVA